MSDLKNVSIENSLATLEDCLASLPGTGETITANITSKIEKAKKSVVHLRKVLSAASSAPGEDPCARRPVVRPEG